MPRSSKFDGVVASQHTTEEGYVYTCDKTGRACWDGTTAARVMLIHDLRSYGKGLHIGQLGWTIPGTTDGYKWIDVKFDCDQQLAVLVSALERVVTERAEEVSHIRIEKYRNTRFDADAAVAEKCRQQWLQDNYSRYISLAEITVLGEGDQELYAFTFPSLRELAILKGQDHYPVKIGYSQNHHEAALGRIREQILERAAYPEKPVVLHIQKTWNGRDLEAQVHRHLRQLDRKVEHSLGTEWFLTSKSELLEILAQCSPAPYEVGHALHGTDETLAEMIGDVVAQGATVEFGMDAQSACAKMSIKLPEEKAHPEQDENGLEVVS